MYLRMTRRKILRPKAAEWRTALFLINKPHRFPTCIIQEVDTSLGFPAAPSGPRPNYINYMWSSCARLHYLWWIMGAISPTAADSARHPRRDRRTSPSPDLRRYAHACMCTAATLINVYASCPQKQNKIRDACHTSPPFIQSFLGVILKLLCFF